VYLVRIRVVVTRLEEGTGSRETASSGKATSEASEKKKAPEMGFASPSARKASGVKIEGKNKGEPPTADACRAQSARNLFIRSTP